MRALTCLMTAALLLPAGACDPAHGRNLYVPCGTKERDPTLASRCDRATEVVDEVATRWDFYPRPRFGEGAPESRVRDYEMRYRPFRGSQQTRPVWMSAELLKEMNCLKVTLMELGPHFETDMFRSLFRDLERSLAERLGPGNVRPRPP